MFNQNLKYTLIKQINSNKISHLTIPAIFTIWICTILAMDSVWGQLYLFLLILVTASGLKVGQRVLLDGIWRFKVFLTIVALFNFWQGNSLSTQTEQLLKLANTLVLTVLANYLTDFPRLLKSIDYFCNYLKPVWLRTAVRKVIYTFLLALRFVPELWQTAEKLAEIKKMRGWQPKKQNYLKRLTETARLIVPLLILTSKKAVELETVFFLKGMNFSAKRTIWQAGNPGWKDCGILLAAVLILIPIMWL